MRVMGGVGVIVKGGVLVRVKGRSWCEGEEGVAMGEVLV